MAPGYGIIIKINFIIIPRMIVLHTYTFFTTIFFFVATAPPPVLDVVVVDAVIAAAVAHFLYSTSNSSKSRVHSVSIEVAVSP
jgi:hypothetical protein